MDKMQEENAECNENRRFGQKLYKYLTPSMLKKLKFSPKRQWHTMAMT